MPELVVSRDPREEADRKKKEEFEKLKLRHDLGNKYLQYVRQVNERVPVEKRKEMDMKRFKPREVPKHMKSRKYLDDIARSFDEPKEVVFQKDLIRNLKPNGTDGKNALLENIKNYDTNMKLKEVRMRYNADSKHAGNDLGDLYIDSIESKLKILDTEINTKKVKAKHQEDEANYIAGSLGNGNTKNLQNHSSAPKSARENMDIVHTEKTTNSMKPTDSIKPANNPVAINPSTTSITPSIVIKAPVATGLPLETTSQVTNQQVKTQPSNSLPLVASPVQLVSKPVASPEQKITSPTQNPQSLTQNKQTGPTGPNIQSSIAKPEIKPGNSTILPRDPLKPTQPVV